MGNMDYELISFQTAVTDIEDIIRQARTIMVPGNWTNPCEKGREHGSMYTKERSYLPCHAQSTHRNSRPRS